MSDDQLLRIAGLVNTYHNTYGKDGRGSVAADVLRAIADVLGPPMESGEPQAERGLTEVRPGVYVAHHSSSIFAPQAEASETLKELNGWRELGEEMGRVISLMPNELFEDWFPDWFGPRLFDLQVAGKAVPPVEPEEK